VGSQAIRTYEDGSIWISTGGDDCENRELRVLIGKPKPNGESEIVARFTFDPEDYDAWSVLASQELKAGNTVVLSYVHPDLMEEDFDHRTPQWLQYGEPQ
jgi:hypothetical protein